MTKAGPTLGDEVGVIAVGTLAACVVTATIDARLHGESHWAHWLLLIGTLATAAYFYRRERSVRHRNSAGKAVGSEYQLAYRGRLLLVVAGVAFGICGVAGAPTSQSWGAYSAALVVLNFGFFANRLTLTATQYRAFVLLLTASVSYVLCVSFGATIFGRESPRLWIAVQSLRFLIAATCAAAVISSFESQSRPSQAHGRVAE